MPVHKSPLKAMRTSARERERNRAKRSRLRAAIKALHEQTTKAAAQKQYREVSRLLDRAASAGLIHRKNADRNKSRLAVIVNRLS